VTLADFTSPGLIIPQLRGLDVATVIQELSQALQREGRVPDLLPFYHAALNREFLLSTGWETGMAFPHARLAAVKEVSFALGRCQEPLSWGQRNTGSVKLVFLIAVPATDVTQYLAVVSGLARLSRNPNLLERLYAAQDTFQILDVLHQVPLRNGARRTGDLTEAGGEVTST
jgi:PTS system fructose-specific IIC component